MRGFPCPPDGGGSAPPSALVGHTGGERRAKERQILHLGSQALDLNSNPAALLVFTLGALPTSRQKSSIYKVGTIPLATPQGYHKDRGRRTRSSTR